MSYRVTMLRKAKQDAQSTFDWIAERSPVGALRWSRALDDAIARLEQSALGFGQAEEADLFVDRDLRQILFKTAHGRTYRAVFVIDGTHVRILRVRGPGQEFLTESDL